MKALSFLALFNFLLATGQNTLQLSKGQEPLEAKIELVSFMEGHWTGTAFGGATEEIWSPAVNGSIMFVFRHMTDGKVNFYEVGHIRELENSLSFELKHFDTNLHGWEEKDEVQQFKFIKAKDNRVYFDGFTFESVNENEINIYGLISNEDGTTNEVVFNYKRAST
ncbi:DUF6265 family protein [Croceitalea rosinachiae]|uniref:DUF6265 family protein n=1 Tax=Croceitalea rosinachiae TaxID=3075596 RepID=A0ABU3A7N8_9FLAO|nr:DUF6265 family protein [Croceitalea sp. F388]MDT0605913.1 DUF6265 family protein [Croceitalea sp. F388]